MTAVVFGTSDIRGSKGLQDRCVTDGVRHGRCRLSDAEPSRERLGLPPLTLAWIRSSLPCSSRYRTQGE